MRILYFHQYFCPPGGSGNNRSFELARTWAQEGHEVSIVTTPASFPEDQKRILLKNSSPANLEFDGIQVHVLKVDYSHFFGFARRVCSFLKFYRALVKFLKRRESPDLIYASSTPPAVGEAARKYSAKWKVPFWFETVDVWPDVPAGMGIIRNGILLRWLHSRVNRIYRESAGIICLSPGMKQQVMSHGVPDSKIMVSLNGTNTLAFPHVARPQRNPVTVLYAGTVGSANGLHHLLGAAKIIREKNSEVRFRIVGDGNDLSRILRMAIEMKLSNVEFMGMVAKQDVPELFGTADIGIVCFANFKVLEANSANKFYDYHSAGLPVVINYGGWQAEFLREFKTGLSSDRGDDEDLAKQILSLAGDYQLRQTMGRNGRKVAEEQFDRRRIAMELMKKFEEGIRKS